MPSASTFLIFLPTTSRSRSRRTTSTSGSSGIAHSRGGVGGVGDAELQPFPRFACRDLFGRLLRTSLAGPVHLAAQQHGGEEALGVIGALVADLVARELVEQLRGELLQARLVVAAAR